MAFYPGILPMSLRCDHSKLYIMFLEEGMEGFCSELSSSIYY